MLFNKIDRDIDAFYSTMLSITPNVGFDIVQSKRVKITPFVGPYTTWLITKGGDRIYYDNNKFVYESYFTNEVRFGLEFGLAVNVLIKDNFSIKIIPFNFQVTRFKGDAYDPDGSNYFLKFTSSILVTL
ncbi:hypothetical protein MNBD_BACTEROID06-1324 [hydrothermal vent metagenome]|uniref:Outer membrane protein beta-barrel domain-containing protein n=1 Tax=hydrothermal vent metagenome TaxID=652676 RepID=A0A3B0UQX4_9ZZZZ